MPPIDHVHEEEYHPYAGWLAALGIVALVFLIGAGFWFHYHGF